MLRRAGIALLLATALFNGRLPAQTTSGPLRVLDAGPVGEINQLQEANEIRVVFSEPMVALGRVPSNPTPPWIRITPAIRGTYRWSGTSILIFTPDPTTPLPSSTRFTVTIDPSATSAAGRALGSAHQFTFTTPTLKLTSARWYRRDDRFDRPAVIVLRFNQPVRPADIVSHVAVTYEPHDTQVAVLSVAARARMAALDAAGLRAFDAKVAAIRAVAARRDAVGVRVTTDWDRQRFLPGEDLVVLETTTAPAPGGWLAIQVDAQATGAQGTERPPAPQRSIVELDPVFFVTGTCESQCNPSAHNAIHFSVDVAAARFATALTVRDVTDPAREQPVGPAATVPSSTFDRSQWHGVEDAGFDRQPPARTWALRLDPSLQSADGQTLGYPWMAVVENWHERAFTSFGDGHGVWETGGGAQLPFYARNYQNVTQWIARLSLPDLVPRLVALQKERFAALPPGPGTPRRLNVTPDAIQSHGLDLSTVLSPAGTGLVWAGLRPGATIPRSESVDRADSSTIVQVTNLGISVKDSPQSTLVFVTRLDNGEPVPGARISIVNVGNSQLWQGTTNTDGIAMAPALPLRQPDNWYELAFVVTAEKDGDVAYVASDWNEGIVSWDFSLPYRLWEANDILRGSVFTDRGVYKPGEQIHVKAIVRADTANGIRLLPAGSTLDIRVHDSRDREVDRRSVTLNRWSSAEWEWTVPAEATLGNYSVRALLPGTEKPAGNDTTVRVRAGEWLREIRGGFLVAAYRRPDFRVDATLAAEPPIAGATLRGVLDARYLFGATMGRRPVRWSVTRALEYGVPAAIREKYPDHAFVFGYYPRDGRADNRVAGEDGTLDANGKLTIAIPSARDVDFAYRYTFEGDVEDVSRQHIANRASVVVHPAPWYIGLRRPDYFADVATGTSVDVVAVDHQGQTVPNVAVTLSLIRTQWNSVRRAEGGGRYSWETERLEIPAGEWAVVTGASPVTMKIPLPEGGSYLLRAIARDAEGRTTRTESWFYGLGKGYTAWERFDHNRFTLEPEKKTWKPGEKARLMIQSPWESATALLTVEREGVKRYERFALTSTQQTVEVALTEQEIPNVYVSVLLIRGRTSNDPGQDGSDPGKPAFKLGYAELLVEDASKRLAVKVTADKGEYRPANNAKISVAVTDAAGKPARSEVTLWAVDYGILSLTDYRVPDVLRSVYQRKALQVMNEDSRQRIVSRRVLTPKGATEGGGGGEGALSNVRRDFRPLAFWLGSVDTDGSGRATTTVKLPESLTTYRIMAVASDTASRFGDANAEIKVNKPVTLLAAFPRFLTMGDRATFGGVISNTLPAGGTATVTIRSLDPAILQFESGVSQTLPLGGGATEPVRFDAVARAVGTARVQMTVRHNGQSDAFETTFPVVKPSPIESSAAAGDVTDQPSTEKLTLPAGALPGIGGFQIDLASTALVGLGEGARYLIDYPYACAEQKASSALALSLSADLGSAFAMSRIAPADYRARATQLLQDLPKYQCTDGGFGYWPGGCRYGSVYLTGYVLHVMKVSGGLVGYKPDDEVITRALDFLETETRRPAPLQVQWMPVWSASQAFSVKVLTAYGRNQDSNITRLVQMADRLPIFSLSYLADAIATTGTRGPRYDEIVRRLTNALRIEGDRAHVEELDQDALAWIWNSNVRATAIVLDGFVRRGDAPLFVPRLVRWLLAARVDGRWRNTQENAHALESLVGYYKAFESEIPNMSGTVTLDQKPIGTATFRGRSTTAQQVRLAMPDLVRLVAAGAERDLTIARAGTGRLYYSSRVQYALAEPPPAVDQGIKVERRYERFVENGESPAATSFAAGDLIRVTLAIQLTKERRFVAVSDAMPAGVEAVDSWFRTTASDLARDASRTPEDTSWIDRFRRGGFDHVEKYDDRVQLFATRLSEGRHEFSYLVRATTAGTFTAAGTTAEEMYAPEVYGRAAPVVVVIK